MAGALDGLRVLDCSTGIAGPLAAMMLADHGADVVKVEPPGGDPGRADPGFAVWHRGKRSVTVDGRRAPGRRLLAELLAAADVCVAGGGKSSLAGSALDPEAALAAHPRLVYLHVPPYLDDAPWAGGAESDALLGAATGVGLRQGSDDGGPVDDVYAHLVTVQGVWAAAAALAAVYDRRRTGCGELVTVAGVHAVAVAAAAGLGFDGAAPVAGAAGRAQGSVPYYRLYECGDSEWLFLAALVPRFTETAFRVLGVGDLLADARLGDRPRAAMLRPEHTGWVTERIAAAFRARSRPEWMAAFAAAGCPVGPVLDRHAWLDHPQLAAIGMRSEVADPERGRVVMPGVPVVLTRTPGAVAGAAPLPGAGAVSWAREEASGTDPPPEPEGAGGGGPLAGVRVVDLGAIIAGPFAASLLAWLGADVVKVEPLAGDSFRGPGFAAYNRGQRGVALDLADGRGRAALLRLVATADVVIDNYRPGVLGRLRIGYDDLVAVNPRIVTVTVTGFGEGGPLGPEPGFDPVLQAMSGMMAAQGGADPPVFYTIPVNDVTAAAMAAFGACAALVHRGRRGAGQRVWTSLAAASALLQARELARWPGKPELPVGGRDHPGPGLLDRYHRVADGWVRVQATDDGLAALVDAGLIPATGDAGAGLPASLSGLTRDEAVAALTRAGVPAAPARRADELARDPEAVAYGLLEPDGRPGHAGFWTAGPPVRFSRSPARRGLVAPDLGEHTRAVLAEAGLGSDEVERLLADGVARQA